MSNDAATGQARHTRAGARVREGMAPTPSLALALALLVSCSGKGSGTVGGDAAPEDTGEAPHLEGEAPPDVIACGQLFALQSTTPTNGAADVALDTTIEATFQAGGSVEEIEGEACDLTLDLRLVIDTDPDPSILDWALLPARLVWRYEGEGLWWLRVEPDSPLGAGEIYAVEADFHVEGELPYGNVWTWSMAD